MKNDTHKKTILLVEDEPSYRHSISEKLLQEGYDVLLAKDGQEGLDQALDQHPDLILVDLEMPKMNGIEMIDHIRADEWGSTALIIVITNLVDSHKISALPERGVTDYFIKSDTKLYEIIEHIKTILYHQ